VSSRSSEAFANCYTRLLYTLQVKPTFHAADTNTDILASILADTSDTRDFLKLFLWQAERHADILATILARMSRGCYEETAPVEFQLYRDGSQHLHVGEGTINFGEGGKPTSLKFSTKLSTSYGPHRHALDSTASPQRR